MARRGGKAAAKRDEDALYDVILFVRPLHRYLLKAVEEQLDGTGVTVGMRAVLDRLFAHGPQTVPQLSRGMELGRQFVLRLVNTGREAGLLAPLPNPAHRRSSLFTLTSQGRAVIEGIRAREAVKLREVAAELDREDIDACVRVLSLMADRFRPSTGPMDYGGDP
ncbi:MarR family transcriptional regulator [Corallococcus coralloides]|nr:MarR family transcriptional regulator [Corallococcus coralloides]